MVPYILNLRNPWDGEMYVHLEDPAPHQVFFHNKAIEEYAEELGLDDHELIPDGGQRTQYYWSGENGILYHTEQGEDIVDPFFDSEEEADRFLDNQAEKLGEDRYSGMVLRKTGNQKVKEATDVLTSQSGIADFAPDGGYELPEGYDRELQELAGEADAVEW